jgi:hypothetical protein
MNKILYLAFGLCTFGNSCTEPIKLDLNNGENNRLVVEGLITTELKKHEVKLSRTSDYFYNMPGQPELGALVNITDGDTTINLFDDGKNGIYKTDINYAGKQGNKYTLNIKLQNGEYYSAQETIKPIKAMDSIRCEYRKSEYPFDNTYYYNINIFAQENPEPGNFYQWEVYINGTHVTDTLRLKVLVDDEMVNGIYINNWTVYRIPENKLKQGKSEITLQMLSISKEWYEFYYAVLSETDFSGGLFSGPPANVPTNISSGALGFFRASAVTESTLEIVKTKSD